MTSDARRLWQVAEPFHAVVYFAPEVKATFERLGLRGFWRAYFAGRAAPLGRVGPDVVADAFGGFHLDFVARAIPHVWDVVTPEQAVAAREAAAGAALRRLGVARPEDADVADRLLQALRSGAPSGADRPLGSAQAALPVPEDGTLRLWHATTWLREHRGDGHRVAQREAGLDGCQPHVLRLAMDGAPIESIRPHRGWSDADWSEAEDVLRGRGWLDAGGAITASGREVHRKIERRTDDLADGPVSALGDDLDSTIDHLDVAVPRLAELIPHPNPIGLPLPH